MFEYDWVAMARRIESGQSPPLPDVLKALYEMGVRHGGGWGNDDELQQIGMALRKSAEPT